MLRVYIYLSSIISNHDLVTILSNQIHQQATYCLIFGKYYIIH